MFAVHNISASNFIVCVNGESVNALYSFAHFILCSLLSSVSNTLQKIPVDEEAWFWIYYDFAQTSSKALLTTNVIQQITIRITDSNDNLIDTNDVYKMEMLYYNQGYILE